ncbi:MAG: hypothetical protein M3Y81_05280 [Chloroflexota bacterium]|nr:hypothetical protein [Chloroflexota bacterium]
MLVVLSFAPPRILLALFQDQEAVYSTPFFPTTVTAFFIGTAASYIIGPLSDLTYLVTERSVSDEVLAPYKASGITILRA